MVAVLGGMLWLVPEAHAVKEFLRVFDSVYLKPGSNDPKEAALAVAVEQAKCAVCHQGEKKKSCNAYGKQFGKLVRKKDKNSEEKVRAALEKVAQMKAKPGDRNSPTFGERIGEGKLPVGTD